MSSLKYWIALSEVKGVGPRRFASLVEEFGSPEAVWTASDSDLAERLHGQESVLWNLRRARSEVDPDELESRVESVGVKVIVDRDDRYPSLLKSIYDHPPVLYCIGEIPPNIGLSVSVVGTRRATAYGLRCAREIGERLAKLGICVVSGMAVGVDASAHQGALAAGGTTVAVLGCGPDVVYPGQNRHLYDRITKAGAVISEFFPGTPPLRDQFPARNRLISGLSRITVVVEAGIRSGALITADFANEQGREVVAVPGEVYSRASAGTNRLISDGATPITDLCDFEAYVVDIMSHGSDLCLPAPIGRRAEPSSGSSRPSLLRLMSLDRPSMQIYDLLSDRAMTVDEIVRATGLTVSEAATAISMLEVKGLIFRHVSGSYGLPGA